MVRRRHRAAGTSAFPGFVEITEIGGGAFSTVYRAVEESTERPVALKALRVENLPPFVVEAFDQEMKALGAVSSHPNIVTLLRPLKTPEHRAVLVLELCEESYAQRIRRTGSLPAREAVSVGIKIAGALETAHQAGFLHRDVKPQNLLVTRYGEPALSDFGVAALRSSAQATEEVFGFTTLHASPEILEGRALSPATDVYGLASTLYQLLSGAAPFAAFEGEAPATVILRILTQPVAPLRDSAIPFELSHLLEEALAKDPDARPQSARSLAEQLRALEAACGWPPTTPVIWQRSDRTGPPIEADLGLQSASAGPVQPTVVTGDPASAAMGLRSGLGATGVAVAGLEAAGLGAASVEVAGAEAGGADTGSGETDGVWVPGSIPEPDTDSLLSTLSPDSAVRSPATPGQQTDQRGTRAGLVTPSSAPRRVVHPDAPRPSSPGTVPRSASPDVMPRPPSSDSTPGLPSPRTVLRPASPDTTTPAAEDAAPFWTRTPPRFVAPPPPPPGFRAAPHTPSAPRFATPEASGAPIPEVPPATGAVHEPAASSPLPDPAPPARPAPNAPAAPPPAPRTLLEPTPTLRAVADLPGPSPAPQILPKPIPIADLPAPKVAPIYTTGSAIYPEDSELESTVLPRLHPVAAPAPETEKPVIRRSRRLFRRRDDLDRDNG